jgi:hypothetical protein
MKMSVGRGRVSGTVGKNSPFFKPLLSSEMCSRCVRWLQRLNLNLNLLPRSAAHPPLPPPTTQICNALKSTATIARDLSISSVADG